MVTYRERSFITRQLRLTRIRYTNNTTTTTTATTVVTPTTTDKTPTHRSSVKIITLSPDTTSPDAMKNRKVTSYDVTNVTSNTKTINTKKTTKTGTKKTTTTTTMSTSAPSSPASTPRSVEERFSPNAGTTTATTTTTTTTTRTNDGISVIGIRTACNGDFKTSVFSTNLAHQLRAVSSPSLTETTQDAGYATTVTMTAQQQPGAGAAVATTTSSSLLLVPGNGSATDGLEGPGSTATTAASQNVGVLQKFKKTFSNFSKPSHQPHASTVLHIPAEGSNNSNATTILSTGNGSQLSATTTTSTSLSPSVTTLSVTSSAAAPGDLPSQTNEERDQTSSKYRFGPLIWRSSKERRKTKYNRRDKCNSGDSGIQIELENDEQFARAIGGGSQGAGGSRIDSFGHKSRIRRANSAKATTNSSLIAAGCPATTTTTTMTAINNNTNTNTTASTGGALSAKAKVLKKMDAYDCRVAPASIPARSLSQPSGLDRLATRRTSSAADLDESDTDSVSSSHPDCNEAHHHHPRPIYAEVLYNFTPASPQELALERGALVEILRKELGPWWYGRIKTDGVVETLFEPQLGWFPKDFVRIIQFPESDGFYTAAQQQQQRVARSKLTSPSMDETLIASSTMSCSQTQTQIAGSSSSNNVTTIIIDPAAEATSTSVKRSSSAYCQFERPEMDSLPALTKSPSGPHENTDILRNSAVKELFDTEVNYVKLLASICRGYLPAMSKRIDIFTPDSIKLIFSNIESIFQFQQQFLQALRRGIEQNRVAQVFLDHQSAFLVYSTYCNSYPRALIELETYSRNKDAKTVLENCRLAENLPELPLSAHLLAPIQRICRYPLHLAELIKTSFGKSPTDAPRPPLAVMEDVIDAAPAASLHEVPDTKESLETALKAMKNVTEAVNEGKRHSENLARHQSNFENFSGPPLHFHSTRYFMQIDATRVSPNLWNNTYTLFLFDHQLIYCKKDILKRQHFIYKGRIFLDSCRILNLPDGKIFGATVKNALRIYCDTRNKWFDFSFRSANRKRRFLTTLALERQFCGKNLFISELAGDEADERDLSDREYHSDYETSMAVTSGGLRSVGATYSNLNLHCKENMYDGVGCNVNVNVNGSGSNSMPESPAKMQKYSDTLPKKSQRHVASTTAITTTTATTVSSKEANYDYSTSSLGRRKLGNWFRKSKSTNSTPNQSPTHQPMVLGAMKEMHSDSSSLSSPTMGNGKPKEMSTSVSS